MAQNGQNTEKLVHPRRFCPNLKMHTNWGGRMNLELRKAGKGQKVQKQGLKMTKNGRKPLKNDQDGHFYDYS